MDTPNSTTPHKFCTKCKRELPETAEYFAPSKAYKNGLNSQCRGCVLTQRREREGWAKERKRSSKARDGFVFCTRCDKELPASIEFFYADTRYKSGFKPVCRPCADAYSREYHARNPEKVAAFKRKYRQEHPEETKRHKSESQKRNRPAANERTRRYNKRNPDKVRERTRIGQHRRRHAGGKFTKQDIEIIMAGQGGNCWWCGNPLNGKYEIDHRIPIARGGTNDPENICLTCSPCNRSKNDKLPQEWNGRLF